LAEGRAEGETRIYMEFPRNTEHENHAVGEVLTTLESIIRL
jgi:hypothetical protein